MILLFLFFHQRNQNKAPDHLYSEAANMRLHPMKMGWSPQISTVGQLFITFITARMMPQIQGIRISDRTTIFHSQITGHYGNFLRSDPTFSGLIPMASYGYGPISIST